MSFSREKVMVVTDTPGEELDCICSIPGVVLTEDSRMLVMLAPMIVVVTEMTGNSM